MRKVVGALALVAGLQTTAAQAEWSVEWMDESHCVMVLEEGERAILAVNMDSEFIWVRLAVNGWGWAPEGQVVLMNDQGGAVGLRFVDEDGDGMVATLDLAGQWREFLSVVVGGGQLAVGSDRVLIYVFNTEGGPGALLQMSHCLDEHFGGEVS